MYNKYVGGRFHTSLAATLVHGPFRNIRMGKLAIADRLHIGEVVRFQTRTFVYNLGGRVTNTYGSAVRVYGGHHEGYNYFAPGCTSGPLLPSYCRIAYIDT